MIGLGSIGKKHIKNINSILHERNIEHSIDAFRSGKNPLPEEIESILENVYYTLDELPGDYDVIFITNPTSMHFETIKAVNGKTKAMFIEKPLFEDTYLDIANLGLDKNCITYVACPLRHKKILQYTKKILEQGENVYSARAISTSYLPEWRKGIDYRTVYSARKELGGGVTLDLIHEWDYLSYLFGIPKKVYHLEGKYSNLEINTEDISLYMADYENMTVELHLDYIGRFSERKLELYCKDYRIDVDILKNKILYHGGVLQEEKMISFGEEDFYRNEMEYFLDMIDGKCENMNTMEHAEKVMELVLS